MRVPAVIPYAWLPAAVVIFMPSWMFKKIFRVSNSSHVCKGQTEKGGEFIHESIPGSRFVGRIEMEKLICGKPAIVPRIEGCAKVYGYNRIIIDEDDPFASGFQVL